MAVDKHPSRRPTAPRIPPATSTTDGQKNTVSKTMTGDGWMEYGSRNGKDLRVVDGHGGERNHDFRDWTDGKKGAMKPGKEAPNEGTVSRASPPGDQKKSGEPG